MPAATPQITTSDDYQFLPEDQPAFPGGPYSPPHPPLHQIGYATVGLVLGAIATLANATVTVNLPNLAGEYGVYLAQAGWLPAIYVAANASANTVLVKARARFSLMGVMSVLLGAYSVVTALQFLVPGFAMQTVVRFVSGVVAAGMTTTSLFYLMQAVPARARPVALIVALGVTQLGTPLARLLPVEMLSNRGAFGQHCIELVSALVTLVLIKLLPLPLPPTPRSNLFEPLDFVTIALGVPGLFLLCGVVGQGRLGWWTDTPWLGLVLVVALVLLTAALAVEAGRDRPLIHLSWIGSREILGFIVVAVLTRIALAEQTYGAVGLLTLGNLNSDQLGHLFVWVIVAMLAGILASVLTLSERALPGQVIAACLSIALGAWMDSHASSLTRPEQLYLSQALIGFGTSLFIGPTLAYGVLKVMREGAAYLVTLIVVFSITQNVGGLVGSALLGSYQTWCTRSHLMTLAANLPIGEAQMAARLQAAAGSLSGVYVDPIVRGQEAAASLVGSLIRQANVLAFNDVFRLVWQLSLGTAVLVGCLMAISILRSSRSGESS